MKKLFALILLFITLQSQAQYPVTQYMGSSNVVVKSRGGLGTDSTFTFATSYSDTSALNRGFLKNIPGVMARVGDNLYLRSALADRWILLGSTSGGVNIYNSDGTITGHRTLSGDGNQMDMTGFSDFNISSSGGLGISYSDGIYGSVSMTHNTGAVGFDISHLASAQSSTINFGTGFLNLATDNSYARIDQTDIKLSTASLQLLNIPRLGQSGKRVLLKDATTNQVSEVAIDSIGGGGQTLQSVTANGDSTGNKIITGDSSKSNNSIVHGSLINGDTVSTNRVAYFFGTSITQNIGYATTNEMYWSIISIQYGWRPYNKGVSATKLVPSSPSDSSIYNRWIAQLPTYNASIHAAAWIEGGTNDCPDNDTTTFKTYLGRMIDTAVARGWPKSRLFILAPPYYTGACTHMSDYATASMNLASAKAVTGINDYTFMQSNGGSSLLADGTHPNPTGYSVMASISIKTITLKKVGVFRVNGNAKILGTTFLGTPPNEYPSYPTYNYPYNAVLGVNGKSIFTDHIYLGGDTSDLGNSGIVNIETSSGQTGINVKQAGVTTNTDIQGGQIDVTDASNQRTRITGTQIIVGNGNLSIQGGSNSDILFSPFGGTIVNYNKASNYDFSVRGVGTSYLINGATTVQRVGIKDSLPQQTLSVRGSGKFTDSLILSGIAANKTDTSANKPLGIDALGNVVKMSYWPGSGSSGSGNNLYVRINKTLSDSIANAPNDSTLVLKSIDIVSSDSTIKVTKTITDSTLKYSLTLRADTCALASFAGGGANAGDTTAFSTSTIYGSFFNSLSDTLVITNLRIGLQGTSPSVGVTVYWNDSLAVTAGATKLVNAGTTATNIYTGTSVTSFDNTKIPPGNWVWVQTTAVTTKPTYMTATLIGYKKRTQ